MKNLLAGILTLVLIGALTYFCFENKSETIKERLLEKANSQYQSESMYWVKTDLEGQDLQMKRIMILDGTAPSQALKEKAEELALHIEGIAGVKNHLTVAKSVQTHLVEPIKQQEEHITQALHKKSTIPSPYELNISKDSDDMVIMTGYVPNKKTKQALLVEANNLFMPVNVIDSLKIADGAPEHWEENALLGLEKLRVLEEGKFRISDDQITFEGNIENQAQHDKWVENIKASLQGDLQSTFNVKVKEDTPKEEKEKIITKTQKPSVPEKKKETTAPVSCQKALTTIMKNHKIHFNYNKATINKNSYKLMDKIINIAKECPSERIIIGGHTDSIGSYAYNKVLSQKRANAVKHYMVKKGIKATRLKAIGYGERKPITSNMEKAGRAKNRRIEFTIQGVKL